MNKVEDLLLKRRSTPLKNLAAPGPASDEMQQILTAAARVPDHGKLFPWYFIVLRDEARLQAGDLLAAAWAEENPAQAEPAKLDLERERFLRAPVVVIVVSRARPGKSPLWEQILSAGAACYNLVLASNLAGYGANWLTEWYGYSPAFKKALGLDGRDNIAGVVYIGTQTEKPEDRDRPDLSKIVTEWSPGKALARGDVYDKTGLAYPQPGFSWNFTAQE